MHRLTKDDYLRLADDCDELAHEAYESYELTNDRRYRDRANSLWNLSEEYRKTAENKVV